MKSEAWCVIAMALLVVLATAPPAHATFPGKNGRIAFGQLTGPKSFIDGTFAPAKKGAPK